MVKKRDLTPAEQEEERKKLAAAWLQKLTVYYLNEMYHEEKEREEEKYRREPFIISMAQYIKERQLIHKLYEKQAGQLSAVEILEKMDKFQEEDSPFRALLKDIKEHPQEEEKITRSLSRCVEEAPVQILNRTRRANAMRKKRSAKRPEEQRAEAEEQQRQARREEERMRYEMTFLRCVMPPELYKQLCDQLAKEGRMVDPAKDFLLVPERPEKSGATYEEYVARHMVSPRDREGQLGNLDEICTAAAYMLAAHEQKGSADFDEKEADLRAMELSGSKAFRAYMKSHPGSLLAAARNTGIEATHRELTALDLSLTKRDGVLASVRDAMRRNASGNTADYHKLMNALDRFVSSAEAPPEQVRNELSLKLAQYVMTEGNPANLNYKKENCDMAARALKALLPKKDFEAFLTTANQNRGPGQKLRAEELEGPVPNAPEASPAVHTGPVLERNEQP